MSDPLISIVIPVRDEGQRISRTIASFCSGRSRPFLLEFVIVDDASTDGCCDHLEQSFTSTKDLVTTRVIRLDTWSGIPFCRNIGGFNATAPILLITDGNVHACNGWDRPVFREIRPGIALCAVIADLQSPWKGYGCQLELPAMGVQWIKEPDNGLAYVPVSPCAGTVIHKQLFLNLGGYDAAMPAYGAAEPEFSVRLWLYGARIRCVPDLVLHHRFRPPRERRHFLDKIRHIQMANYLRFGLLYLDQQNSRRMLEFWAQTNTPAFYKAWSNLDHTEISNRRNYLQQNLKYDLDWLAGLFRLKQSV